MRLPQNGGCGMFGADSSGTRRNGVLGARKTARGSHLQGLSDSGVTLLADDFALKERGIRGDELLPAVKPANIDALVDILTEQSTKAIWH